MSGSVRKRRLPIGAEVMDGGVHFRIWAPGWRTAAILLEGEPSRPGHLDMDQEPGGYFSRLVPGARAGTLYRFIRDRDGILLPDPASRFQPDGPFGPSEVIDPDAFAWSDDDWPGIGIKGQIVYELHVGAFTPRAPSRRPPGSCPGSPISASA